MLGAIVAGISMSVLFRPLLVFRYLYPVSIIAWLLLGVCVSKCKLKTLYTAIVLILICGSGFPKWRDIYKSDKRSNDALQKTLNATTEMITGDDILLTNVNHIAHPIFQAYYPDIKMKLIANNLNLILPTFAGVETTYPDISNYLINNFPVLDDKKTYWLFLKGNEAVQKSVTEKIIEQGFTPVEEVLNGNLGTHWVRVYKIYHLPEIVC